MEKGEYVPELTRLRGNMLSIIGAYSEHFKIEPVSALQKVLRNTYAVNLYAGGDIKAGSYDKWAQAFSKAWPDDLEWPKGVVRPPVDSE